MSLTYKVQALIRGECVEPEPYDDLDAEMLSANAVLAAPGAAEFGGHIRRALRNHVYLASEMSRALVSQPPCAHVGHESAFDLDGRCALCGMTGAQMRPALAFIEARMKEIGISQMTPGDVVIGAVERMTANHEEAAVRLIVDQVVEAQKARIADLEAKVAGLERDIATDYVHGKVFREERWRANRLGDEAGALATQNTELLAENARLRRAIEKGGKR